MRTFLRRLAPTAWVAALVVGLAIVITYSNAWTNPFELDDTHTIVDNPAIRDYHVGRYFKDVHAFTVLPANADYRPLLLVSYATNYKLAAALHGDGYDPRTWHWINALLHGITALGVFLLGRRLIGSRGVAPLPNLTREGGDMVALTAAGLYAIHPVNAEAVNYISARSSTLVAAILVLATTAYLRAMTDGWRWRLLALGLYVLALFTKIEAIAFAAIVVVAELALEPTLRAAPFWRRLRARAMWLRLAPFLVLAVVYYKLWKAASPMDHSPTAAPPGMGAVVYLSTQLRGWWHYLGEVIAPDRLIIDDAAYPIAGGEADASQLAAGVPLYSAWRAVTDPTVWLAAVGVLGVGVLALRSLKPAPAITFLLAAFVIFLSPTSSVLPLAEMVNGHRAYLPDTGIFLIAALGLWLLVRKLAARPRRVFPIVLLVIALPLFGLTRARNRVWANDLNVWGDTAAKTPDSSRAQMNYGLALMERGRYPEAEVRFRRAVSLAPNYDIAHINLAILLDATGKSADAQLEYDAAVRVGSYGPNPFYWRGRYRAKNGDLPGMLADFQAATDRNPSAFREAAGLAAALAASGRAAEAEQVARRYGAVDPAGFAAARAEIASMYVAPDSPAQLNGRGVDLMQHGQYADAEALFRQALAADPSFMLAEINLGLVRGAQGDPAGALAAFSRAHELQPMLATPLYWRARYFIGQGDDASAIEDLKNAVVLASDGVTENAALIETLLHAGRGAEAQPVIDRLNARGDGTKLEAERAAFRPVFPVKAAP